MERQRSASYIQKFSAAIFDKGYPQQFSKKNNDVTKDLLIFGRLVNDTKNTSSCAKFTPMQTRMKDLMTDLIHNNPPRNYNQSSGLYYDDNSMTSKLQNEKVSRKKEEILNMFGGYNCKRGSSAKLSSSCSGSNIMSGIRKEVNTIIGNINRIVNSPPKYIKYPKTNNDFNFLSNQKRSAYEKYIQDSFRKEYNHKPSTRLNHTSFNPKLESSQLSRMTYDIRSPVSTLSKVNNIKLKLGLSAI